MSNTISIDNVSITFTDETNSVIEKIINKDDILLFKNSKLHGEIFLGGKSLIFDNGNFVKKMTN